MSFLSKVFGRLSGDKPAQPPSEPGTAASAQRLTGREEGWLRQDLGRLDKVAPGLGEGLVRYVRGDGNDSIKLTLQQHSQAAAQQIGRQMWSSGGDWTPGRSDLLLRMSPWRPDVARRYGEVLAIVFGDQSWPRLPGSERSPLWFRRVLSTYGESRGALAANGRNRGLAKGPSAPALAEAKAWTAGKLASLLADDFSPILDAAFEADERPWASHMEAGSPAAMEDFEGYLRADPAARATDMRTLSAKARAYGLRTLARLGVLDDAYLDFAFEQAIGTARGAREAAVLLLRSAPSEALTARARATWPTLKATQKTELARLLAAVCGADFGALATELTAEETNASVRAEFDRLLGQQMPSAGAETAEARADGPEGYTALHGARVAAPPAAPLPPDTPSSPALRRLLEQAVEHWRMEAQAQNAKRKEDRTAYRMAEPPSNAAARLVDLIEGRDGRLGREVYQGVFGDWLIGKSRVAARDAILASADLTLWHLLRAFRAGWGGGDPLARAVFYDTPPARAIRDRLFAGHDLRTYSDMCASLGGSTGQVVFSMVADEYWRPDLSMLPPQAVWPEALHNLNLIDEALGLVPPSGKQRLSDQRALDLLAVFPTPPKRYFAALLDRALGDRKAVRQPARDLLAAAPNIDGLLIPLLAHPKAEMRASAAAWLADRKAAEALQPLLAAARKEKAPAAKAAMLTAASRLGGDIADFVSPDALLSEAEAGLAKTLGKGLEWFPFDGMPTLRRRDGTALDGKVLRWWAVLAVKLKEPGGNAWFDLLLDQLDPASAAEVGQAVMAAWIAWDSRRPTDAEANAYAEQNADGLVSQYKRWQPDFTREKAFSQLRALKLGEYFGSANDSKGVLALSVRAPGAAAAGMVKTYFRDHYPRTAQCKALLESLAGNPSPAAIQLVLAVSKRWRTRTVQERAAELVQAIADRRGWTAEELADRTIPTAGLDDRGVLELPIGERLYSARLDAEGRLALFNPEGKPVGSLPASAAGEEEALKAAKAALSTGKKELKQAYELQTTRLYEALCAGREWPLEDWRESLFKHPIVGRLVQRLVWLGLDGEGKVLAAFRPMDDLSLTDAADASVDPGAFARVRLAHATDLDGTAVAAWREHLADYEVQPLFDQFGRPVHVIEALSVGQTDLNDRQGWMIETFKLRGAAGKRGYARGPAGDGGWFTTYEKPFGSVGLTAVIEFTGSPLPEENRPAALQTLRFVKGKTQAWGGGSGVRLKTVPPVLLSEVWNDLHEIAAAGSGFDADWEKKVSW